jgi:hypothetical protein
MKFNAILLLSYNYCKQQFEHDVFPCHGQAYRETQNERNREREREREKTEMRFIEIYCHYNLPTAVRCQRI